MPRNDSVLPGVEQFEMKGRELIALAVAIMAKYDESEAWPPPTILTVRRRAIVLLEGAISFVEAFLQLCDRNNGGATMRD